MDTLRLDQQYQHLDDTPVRRGGPRYRRTNSELLIDGNSVSPAHILRIVQLASVRCKMRWTLLGFPRALRSFRIEAHAA